MVLNSGQVVYPDFLLLDMRQRKTVIYEHFGMMDNPQYAQKAIEKLALYLENDYWYGDTLFFTFETTETPLNTKITEGLISNFSISIDCSMR